MTLGGLMLVLGGIWLTQYLRGGPPLAAGAAAMRAVTSGLTTSPTPAPGAANPSIDRLLTWAAEPRPPLTRDLFRIDAGAFTAVALSEPVKAVKSEGGFWRRLDKSVAQAVDEDARRAELANDFARRAQTLRLQTTLMGNNPRALIDGTLLGVGDIVAAGAGSNRIEFRVLQIEARHVVLEREGIRLELRMAQ